MEELDCRVVYIRVKLKKGKEEEIVIRGEEDQRISFKRTRSF